ncbi:YdhR family protein [Occallatibacter riparius]|uniref:YdhR family protein n=1 Tax=Occallatibacter riparius TaxID=1002689 RepID=A0A9J7BNY7_9BACT|nr:YdhR family protein [Occallatibacter riparius]UWZ84432.1 YdhR family protein [Occallatibacter riparius]
MKQWARSSSSNSAVANHQCLPTTQTKQLEKRMSEEKAFCYTILQLRFKLRVEPGVFLAHSREPAAAIAKVKGLIWKIWVFSDQESEVGGVYLFVSREAAQSYLSHPVIQAVHNHPAVESAQSQFWDVENSLSAITRAPLPEFLAGQFSLISAIAGGQ